MRLSKHLSSQIIATSHYLGPPKKVAEEGTSPDFRKIKVGETLKFGQIHIRSSNDMNSGNHEGCQQSLGCIHFPIL